MIDVISLVNYNLNYAKSIVLLLCFYTFVACKPASSNLEVKKTNIIVILVDDAGYIDFGFMGSKDLETPHIDKLAKNGIVFTDAHVSASVCAPSRAGLITGKYQQRFGFEANGTGDKESGELGLSDNVNTIGDIFKQNEYKTIALGKWHLGSNDEDHPNKRGFDDFFGFIGGSRSYFPIENPSKNQMLQNNGKHVEFTGYLTDVIGDKAANYIEENREDPFFMYLAFNAMHTPMQAKEEHLEKYKNHRRKKLAAMTWSLDENIGKIMTALETSNNLDNTLIYFLSDNGGATTNQSLNGALKGFKGNKFEGGHRVPFIVHWKNHLKGNRKFDGLTSSLDIFSTSLVAADIKKNKSLELDGVNLLPYLLEEKKGNPHQQLFWRKLEGAGTRIGDFKLIRLENYGSVLYNLKEDLGETTDLSTINKNKLFELTSRLEDWENTLIAPLWREGTYWKGITSNIHKNLMQNNYRDVLSKNNFIKKNKVQKN